MLMENKEKDFERFVAALESTAPSLLGTFRELCLACGLTPENIDRKCVEYMGLSGEEIVKSYKYCLPVFFL